MKNNDILRRVRYIFNLNDARLEALFAAGGKPVTNEDLINYFKPDDDPTQKSLHDVYLAAFLNGFITMKRGAKEGAEAPKPETRLTNNDILKKLKIALSLKDEDILEILALMDFRVTKTELSAFFRSPTQSQYKLCKDQILRNFLFGLQMKQKGKLSTSNEDKA